MDYLYDGSFDGLLTCIYHHYYTEKASDIFRLDSYQMNLTSKYMIVETDETKASRVYEAMEEKISHYAVRCMYEVFLSAAPYKEMKILNFAVLGFRTGAKITYMHGNDTVVAVERIVKRIGVEVEKMCSFVRFEELECGVLYGQIEPDNDVTELLWRHFANRYKNEPFIIHDVGRSKALFAYQEKWYIAEFNDDELPGRSNDEVGYQKLWQSYFDNIAIKERINLRCQRNFVPMRYRKHLTEFRMREI